MATFIRVADIVETRIYCTLGDQCSCNVSYWVCTAKTALGVSDQEWSIAHESAIHTTFKALISTPAFFRGVESRIKTITPKPAAASSNAHAGAGTAGATACPRQTAGLITTYTPYAGAAGRGRIYVPFPSVSDDTGSGSPTAGYITKLNAAATWLYSSTTVVGLSGTADMYPALWRPPSGFWVAITSWLSRDKWATQKRRGDYGRPNQSPI